MEAGDTWPVPRLVASTGSTNDDVAALADSGAPDGTCVVAEEQTAGRGRLDRTWVSPPGSGLWMSALIRTGDQPVARWSQLSIVAGVAVVDALRTACGVRAELKWPNDIVVIDAACGGGGGLRKLGGILSQAVGPDAVVLGIGVNVAMTSADLPVPGASSVLLEGGRLDRAELLIALLVALHHRVEQWRRGDAALMADYRTLCSTIGRLVAIELPGGVSLQGEVVAIDDDGHVVVFDGQKTSTVTAGDVIHATI